MPPPYPHLLVRTPPSQEMDQSVILSICHFFLLLVQHLAESTPSTHSLYCHAASDQGTRASKCSSGQGVVQQVQDLWEQAVGQRERGRERGGVSRQLVGPGSRPEREGERGGCLRALSDCALCHIRYRRWSWWMGVGEKGGGSC